MSESFVDRMSGSNKVLDICPICNMRVIMVKTSENDRTCFECTRYLYIVKHPEPNTDVGIKIKHVGVQGAIHLMNESIDALRDLRRQKKKI